MVAQNRYFARVSTTSEGSRPRLRPLSLGEILDVSIKICLAHWRTLLKAVLVVVVPVQIIGTIVNADYTIDSLDFRGSSTQTPQETFEQINQYLGGLAIAAVLQILALLLATAACLRAIAQSYLGEQSDWRSSLSHAFRLAPSLLLLSLLYGLGLAVAFVLLVLPSIWLYVAWAFALPALLVEGLRGRKALGRSYHLVKGRWWRTFGVIAVGFILATILSTVAQAVFFVGIFAGEGNDAFVLVLSTIAGIAGLAVSTPFQAALLTVLYFDLRVRREGFDLELLAQEIGASVQPAAAGAVAAEPEPVPPPVPPPAERTARGGTAHWPPPPSWKPPRAAEGSDDAARGLPPQDSSSAPPDEPPPGEPPRLPGVPHG